MALPCEGARSASARSRAERRDLLALLLRDAVIALAVAVVLGVGLGFAAVRHRVQHGGRAAAPRRVTMIAVPLTLSAVILTAWLRPVRRSARVNPIDVLRALWLEAPRRG